MTDRAATASSRGISTSVRLASEWPSCPGSFPRRFVSIRCLRGRRNPGSGAAEASQPSPGGVARTWGPTFRSNAHLRLQLGDEVAREAREAIEFVQRLEAARSLAVGEQAPGLGDGEPQLAQLLVARLVQVDQVLVRSGRRMLHRSGRLP